MTNNSSKNILSKVKLGGYQKLLFLLTFAGLWLSGVIWVGLHFLNAGSQGYRVPYIFLKIHGAIALLFLILLGSLWGHVQRAWELKVNRLSGLMLISISGWLTVTAWVLYYVVNQGLRDLASLTHWTIGLLIPLVLVGHIFRQR